jgi:hypothetical protein
MVWCQESRRTWGVGFIEPNLNGCSTISSEA